MTMQTFSIRDLRDRSGELTHEAEQGRMSIITKHGKPLWVSVPFTEELIQLGVLRAVVMNLYRSQGISAQKAAKMARMPLEDFQRHLDLFENPVAAQKSPEIEPS